MQKAQLKPDMLKKIIADYYQKTMDIPDVQVVINPEILACGCGPYEDTCCAVKFIIKIKRVIFGAEQEVEQELTADEIKQIIIAGLNADNLDLVNLEYDDGIHNEWQGYGYNESRIEKPYFNGINITIKDQKANKKILG